MNKPLTFSPSNVQLANGQTVSLNETGGISVNPSGNGKLSKSIAGASLIFTLCLNSVYTGSSLGISPVKPVIILKVKLTVSIHLAYIVVLPFKGSSVLNSVLQS